MNIKNKVKAFATMWQINDNPLREHYTTKHTGKMEGMYSLSTSSDDNPFCIARKQCGGMVCDKCYVKRIISRFPKAKNNCLHNSKVLRKQLFQVSDFPIINAHCFRLESFGDLANVTQMRNYIRLCKRNPRVRFALWTKNVWFVDEGVMLEGKPKNLVIIQSSEYVNKVDGIYSDNVDKVFTVYDKKYLSSHPEVKIQCGRDKKCLTCLACYYGKAKYINEVLK